MPIAKEVWADITVGLDQPKTFDDTKGRAFLGPNSSLRDGIMLLYPCMVNRYAWPPLRCRLLTWRPDLEDLSASVPLVCYEIEQNRVRNG